MPATRLRMKQFRSAWWRRASMLGVAGAAIAATALVLATWARFAPREHLAEGVATPVEQLPALRSFVRTSADERTIAAIAQNNVLSATRADFTRETAVAEAPVEQDTGARDKQKRLESAKAALSTLRLVAILRLKDQWIALFEPSVRKAEEDLLSLRVGDVWQGWTISAIERDEVHLGFEGYTERVTLRPDARKAQAKAPAAKGRAIVEARPVKSGREVSIDPPITTSEARQRLLGATRDEDERVRKLAEDLLKDVEREHE